MNNITIDVIGAIVAKAMNKKFTIIVSTNEYISEISIYDENANSIFLGYNCDYGTGQNCKSSVVNEYDTAGNLTISKYDCDGIGQNCQRSDVYEEDKALPNGGRRCMSKECDGTGQNCQYSKVYEYDAAGNKTMNKYGCDVTGIRCTNCEAYSGSCVKNSQGYYDPEDTVYDDDDDD